MTSNRRLPRILDRTTNQEMSVAISIVAVGAANVRISVLRIAVTPHGFVMTNL